MATPHSNDRRSFAESKALGSLLGPSCRPLGGLLDPLWRLLDPLGRLLGPLGRLLGPLGASQGGSWSLQEGSRASQESPRASQEGPRHPQEPSRRPPRGPQDAFWILLEAFWRVQSLQNRLQIELLQAMRKQKGKYVKIAILLDKTEVFEGLERWKIIRN